MRTKQQKKSPVWQAKRNDQMQALIERAQDMYKMYREGLITQAVYDTFREAVKLSYTQINHQPY